MNLFGLDGFSHIFFQSATIVWRNLLFTPNLRLRACLEMCLNFPLFEPEIAYKTLAYKKKCIVMVAKLSEEGKSCGLKDLWNPRHKCIWYHITCINVLFCFVILFYFFLCHDSMSPKQIVAMSIWRRPLHKNIALFWSRYTPIWTSESTK